MCKLSLLSNSYWFSSVTTSAGDYCNADGQSYTYSYERPWEDNIGAMSCEILTSIFLWLITFVSLCVFGTMLVVLGSIGNFVGCKRFWKPLTGMFVVAMIVLIPYGTSGVSSDDKYLGVTSLILGMITCSYHLSHMLSLLLPASWVKRYPRVMGWLVSSTINAERHVKHAAAHKLAIMTQNALDIVIVNDREHVMKTHFGQALHAYSTFGKKYEKIGGLIWCWKRIYSREAFKMDGLWISTRLIAANIAQYIVSLYTMLVGIRLTKHAADNYNIEAAKSYSQGILDRIMSRAVDEDLATGFSTDVSNLVGDFLWKATVPGDLGCGNASQSAEEVAGSFCESVSGFFQCDQTVDVNYLCPLVESVGLDGFDSERLGFLNASGFDVDFLLQTAKANLQLAADDSVDSLYPSEKYMVVVPLAIGTVVAFLTALFLAVMYMPSVMMTILKLRSGNIPSLRDHNFNMYRIAPDQVAILTGSLFWGSFISALFVGGFVGLLVFFLLWQASIYFVQRLVAIVIGVLIVTVIRLGIVKTCRRAFYQGFYRKRPAGANISMLALEWAFFALSAGFIFIRMVKLLLAAGASIGRIDSPFLAPGVGKIGPLELDNYPTVHLKDVLSQEAHRHPYIEQLGSIYLMKLRYREHFGKTAGSCWRLLFVYALMPWLHKYRVSAHPELDENAKGGSRDPRDGSSLKFVNLQRINVEDDNGDPKDGGSPVECIAGPAVKVEERETIQSIENEISRLRTKLQSMKEAKVQTAGS
jgi:hypothetical protein